MADFDMGRPLWTAFVGDGTPELHLGWMQTWCDITVQHPASMSERVPQDKIEEVVTCQDCIAIYAARRLGASLHGPTATHISRDGLDDEWGP